jgi:hypothetical protein
MKLIDLIANGNLNEAKELVYNQLDSIVAVKMEQAKRYVAESTYTKDDQIDEAAPKRPSTNVVRVGRIKRIRRRIRRNTKGRIVVQRNRRVSAVKGYRISGNSLKRITAVQRINKTRKLKRYWKTKGRAKLQRTLMKRRVSMRRRKSMGIR